MVSSTYKDEVYISLAPRICRPSSHGDTVHHAQHVLCGCVERHSGDVLHWIVHPNEIGFRWFEMIISIELCVSLANL